MTNAEAKKMKKAEIVQHAQALEQQHKHLLRQSRYLIRKLTRLEGNELESGSTYSFPDHTFITLD